jgi:hypothetical protein
MKGRMRKTPGRSWSESQNLKIATSSRVYGRNPGGCIWHNVPRSRLAAEHSLVHHGMGHQRRSR